MIDSSSANELVCSILENLGLEIWRTEDANDVLALVLAHPPQLLIADIDVEWLVGVSVIAELHTRKLLETTKVLALVSGHQELQHPLLEQSRIDRVLLKPVRAATLRAAVTELVPSVGAH